MKNVYSLMSLCVLTTVLLTTTLRAQTSSIVPEAEASQHVDQNVTVEGIVTAVKTSRKGNTFINCEGIYPDQTSFGNAVYGTYSRYHVHHALEKNSVSFPAPCHHHQDN
jgi:hypothetical protein